jgi:hypothetical protein
VEFHESSPPLQAKNMIGRHLDSIDGGHEWFFETETKFILLAGKQPLTPNVLEALLGPGRTALRIEGKWRLDNNNTELVLTEIQADGKDGLKEARLPVQPAGLARVNIGPYQYNRWRPGDP